MQFSKIEIMHLLKAWGAISLAFAIAMVGPSPASLLLGIPFAMITVGIGFLVHELAHKFVAQRYKCWAEFRADNKMLLVAIILSFTGFIFAAPGAVYIHGAHLSKKQNGLVSLAGPAVNIVAAICFGTLAYFFSQYKLLSVLGSYGLTINAWLGLFNLLPFGPLDGKKVFEWSKIIWGISAAVCVTFLFFAWI